MGSAQGKEVVYAEAVTQPGKGETAIYRHVNHKDALVSAPKTGEQTMKDVFLSRFKNNKNSEYLGQRKVLSATEIDPKSKRPVPVLDNKYSYKTFGQVEEVVRALGSAIKKLNLAASGKFSNCVIEVGGTAERAVQELQVEVCGHPRQEQKKRGN